jgi:hypothetical protein
MRKKTFYTIIGLIIFCSWTTQSKNGIKKARWLIGIWESKTLKGSIYEEWTKISDDEFSGKSYFLKEKDTVVTETIRLLQEQDGLYYIPAVKDQNNGLSVRFALKTVSDTGFVFKNLEHDFPQIISYTKVSADSCVAEISGMKNGQKRKQTFPMKRIK